MRTAKLTLSVKPEVIQEAKQSAAALHTSLSALFERLLRALSAPSEVNMESSPITRRASGLLTLPSDVKDADLLTDALKDKYGVGP